MPNSLRWTVKDGGEYEFLAPVGKPYNVHATVVHHPGYSVVYFRGTPIVTLKGGLLGGFVLRRKAGRALAEAYAGGITAKVEQ
jgi:hypothetical protein